MAEPPKKTAKEPTSSLGIVFEQLACPACLGELRMDEECVVCRACGRVYPVLDGIPVLIAEQADARSEG